MGGDWGCWWAQDSGKVFIAKVAQWSRVNKIGQWRNRGGRGTQEHKEPQVSREDGIRGKLGLIKKEKCQLKKNV